MKVILLAAGRGRRFGRRTAALPKCLIPLGPATKVRHHALADSSQGARRIRRAFWRTSAGMETLLSRYLDSFRKLGLYDIVLVVGHEKEKIVEACVEHGRGLSIRFLHNPLYKKGSIVSLYTARGEMQTDCLIMDADVYFRAEQLKGLLSANRSAFLLDPRSKSTGEEMVLMARRGKPVHISKRLDSKLHALGEATGFLKLKKKDASLLARILEKMVRSGKTECEYEESYNMLMKSSRLGVEKISGFWTEMDFEEDLNRIRRAKP